jgi:hypothetical protein
LAQGMYTTVFWIIFNLGAMIGGFITFAIEFDSSGAGGVSPITYFTFCIFMIIGSCIGMR